MVSQFSRLSFLFTLFLQIRFSFSFILDSPSSLGTKNNFYSRLHKTNVKNSPLILKSTTEDKDAKKSFNIRDIAPNILLLANIGAVQLNYGITHQECNELINSIDADGIYLHLNSLQEVIQPEGDTNFQDLDVKIKKLINTLKKPILIKEVGCGFSDSDFKVLSDIGIKYIDISGSGGTSWSYVESKRSNNSNLGELFKDWGIPTPIALKLSRPYKDKFTFISYF